MWSTVRRVRCTKISSERWTRRRTRDKTRLTGITRRGGAGSNNVRAPLRVLFHSSITPDYSAGQCWHCPRRRCLVKKDCPRAAVVASMRPMTLEPLKRPLNSTPLGEVGDRKSVV